MSAHTSAKAGNGRGAVKALITVGALAATAFGWLLYGGPAPTEGAQASTVASTFPATWLQFLEPLPTLVPDSGGAAPSAPAQPVLRRVNLPAPAPVTITRSSR
jgi:hypothetical protein